MEHLDTYTDILDRESQQTENWVARAPLADILRPLIGDESGSLSQRRLASQLDISPRGLRKILTGRDASPFVPFSTACRLLSAANLDERIDELDVFCRA